MTLKNAKQKQSQNNENVVQSAIKIWGKPGQDWGIRDRQITVHHEAKTIIYTADLWHRNGAREVMFPIESSWKLNDTDCVEKAAGKALTKGLSNLGFMDTELDQPSPKPRLEEVPKTKTDSEKVDLLNEQVMVPRKKIGEKVFSECLSAFGASDIAQIKKEHRIAFINVMRSYADMIPKSGLIEYISGPLRKSFQEKTTDPELYGKFMGQFDIKIPADAKDDEIGGVVSDMLEDLEPILLNKIFREIHFGLNGIK